MPDIDFIFWLVGYFVISLCGCIVISACIVGIAMAFDYAQHKAVASCGGWACFMRYREWYNKNREGVK